MNMLSGQLLSPIRGDLTRLTSLCDNLQVSLKVVQSDSNQNSAELGKLVQLVDKQMDTHVLAEQLTPLKSDLQSLREICKALRKEVEELKSNCKQQSLDHHKLQLQADNHDDGINQIIKQLPTLRIDPFNERTNLLFRNLHQIPDMESQISKLKEEVLQLQTTNEHLNEQRGYHKFHTIHPSQILDHQCKELKKSFESELQKARSSLKSEILHTITKHSKDNHKHNNIKDLQNKSQITKHLQDISKSSLSKALSELRALSRKVEKNTNEVTRLGRVTHTLSSKDTEDELLRIFIGWTNGAFNRCFSKIDALFSASKFLFGTLCKADKTHLLNFHQLYQKSFSKSLKKYYNQIPGPLVGLGAETIAFTNSDAVCLWEFLTYYTH